MTSGRRVVVVGGGISGLTTAYWLQAAGVDVTVLDRASQPGGTMKTLRQDGWLVETGPNSALETTPLIGELVRALKLEEVWCHPSDAADRRYILRGGTLHPLPMSPGAFFRSGLWTTAGKFRLLKEPFIGRATEEETVAQFVERRLGREFLDYAINPFVAGVYAGNPEQLSVRSAFPKLYALEEKYGGLIKGMIRGARERKKRAEKAKDRAKMFSFRDGMQTLPVALANALGERFRPNAQVHNVRCSGDGASRFTVAVSVGGAPEQLPADAVVLAVPAFACSPLVRGMVPALAETLQNIYYPAVAEVYLGYRLEDIGRELDGFGYLIPAVERRSILGTIWSSVLFPGRAPEGHVALTSFVGGSRQPDLLDQEDDRLVDLTHGELTSLMGARARPVFSRVIRWEKAIPQYNLGYHRIVGAIEAAEREHPGLFFCANYRGGIAVGDCVMSGRRTANAVVGLGERMRVDSR